MRTEPASATTSVSPSRASSFVLDRFRDSRHGGFFWKTDRAGRVRNDRKILYGQLFVLYALVEYVRAGGDRGALAEARELFELVVERAHDNASAAGWSTSGGAGAPHGG